MTPRLAHPWLAAALVALSLTACGGGGDDGGNVSPGDPVSPNPTNPTNPTTVTGSYRLESGAATNTAALAKMNELGQQGYGFVSSVAPYQTSIPIVIGDLYVKDSAHATSKLQYTMDPPATTVAALVARLNQLGATGAMYKGDVGFGTGVPDIRSLFVKDAAKTATFAYEAKPTSLPAGKAALLAEINAQGARGYRFMSTGVIGADTANAFNLYVKVSAPAATYTYSFVDVASPYGMANGAALKQQLNAKGANGEAFLGAYVVGSVTAGTGVQIYEKSSLQTTPITYDVVDVDTGDTLAASTAKHNVRAAAGDFLFSDLMMNDGKFYTVYVKGALSNRHPLSGPVFP